MKHYWATIISTIFEPLIVLAVLAAVAGLHANLSTTQLIQYFVTLLLVMIGPVVVFRVWLVKKHGIDWDIHDRRRRIKPLIALCGFVLVDTLFIQLLGSKVLTHMFLVFAAWVVGFLFVTLKWKMSGHSGIAALATGMLVAWFGWSWWPVLLLVPLIGWARVVRKDHTLPQVIVGALYSWMIVALSRVIA